MAKVHRSLLIDISPKDDYLTWRGEVVWPVRNEFELNGLRMVAKVFGSTVKSVTGQVGRKSQGKEQVVGLGTGTEEVVRLYSHLTNRRFHHVESKEELVNGVTPAVVITRPEHIDTELLEFLYTPKANVDVVPGLLFAENVGALRRQALIRSAAANLCGKLQSVRTDVYPLIEFGRRVLPGYEVLGEGASPGDIREAIGRGSGLLVLSTHSDGIDAKLGNELTLCPMTSTENTSEVVRSPVCHATQFCHRYKTSFPEVVRSGKLVSPQDIAARIFVLNSCTGLRFQSGMVDVRWSLAQHFCNSETVGAIVTTWEVVITRPNQIAFLGTDLLRGVSVGEAIARYNRSSEARRYGRHRLCLLGDPRVRLPQSIFGLAVPDKRRKALRKVKVPESDEIKNSGTRREGGEFFHKCFSYLATCAGDDRERLIIRNVLDEIGISKRFIGKKSLTRENKRVVKGMVEAISHYILERGGQFHAAWTPLVDKFSAFTSVDKCGTCHELISTTQASIPCSRDSRRLLICPNCGIIEDSPTSLNLKLFLNHRTLELRGGSPKTSIASVLLKTSNMDSDNKIWPWPTLVNGELKREFEIPQIFTPSFATLSVIIVWEEGYVIQRRLTRALMQSTENR